MLSSIGAGVYRLRRAILVAAGAFLVFSVVWGTGVFGQMSGNSSLTDPDSESQRIGDRIERELGPTGTDFVGLYKSSENRADSTSVRSAVEDVAASVRDLPGVEFVGSYYDSNDPTMISEDGRETILAVRLVDDADDDEIEDVADALELPDGAPAGLTSQVGGSEAVDLAIDEQVPADIAQAEMIAMPLLLIALLIVFGSVVSAAMPVLIGAFAVMGAFTVVRGLTYVTEVSIFSLNIITILGLGLAVDYGLFVVSRFREELNNGPDVREALIRTMQTAGRMVLVSGLLVTLALSSLTLFPQVLLRSMGIGGAAAVACAMVVSLTALPATLAVLGHRINAWRLPWARRRKNAASGHASSRWSTIANHVMRRPVPYLLASLGVLILLALPFSQIKFGGVDERMLPEDTESRVVAESVADGFPEGNLRPVRVLLSGADEQSAEAFSSEIAGLPSVSSVDVVASEGGSTAFSVGYEGNASSDTAQGVVTDIRDLTPPGDAEVMVGGSSAEVVDQLDSLGDRLPWMLGLVAGITFLMLAFAFRSIVVPLKAIAMNILSIGAAFGVVTWIFQDGNLSGWLNFTPTGYIEASQPILMVAILFGLSMDYEVFVLSRIRETWLETGDNRTAVAKGIERTGPIITTAAVLMCIVVGFFSMSGITFIKMIGVGMVVAILVDATLVRLILVPVTMRLLGRRNWWAPGFLRGPQPAPERSTEDQASPVETRVPDHSSLS